MPKRKKISKTDRRFKNLRYTINGNPIFIVSKLGKGIYLAKDFDGQHVQVAERDLEDE